MAFSWYPSLFSVLPVPKMWSRQSQVQQHMTACVTCAQACDLVVYHCPVVMAKLEDGITLGPESRPEKELQSGWSTARLLEGTKPRLCPQQQTLCTQLGNFVCAGIGEGTLVWVEKEGKNVRREKVTMTQCQGNNTEKWQNKIEEKILLAVSARIFY